jgi:hypothetical protein
MESLSENVLFRIARKIEHSMIRLKMSKSMLMIRDTVKKSRVVQKRLSQGEEITNNEKKGHI